MLNLGSESLKGFLICSFNVRQGNSPADVEPKRLLVLFPFLFGVSTLLAEKQYDVASTFQEWCFYETWKVKTQVSLEGLRSFLRHISALSCLSNLFCFLLKHLILLPSLICLLPLSPCYFQAQIMVHFRSIVYTPSPKNWTKFSLLDDSYDVIVTIHFEKCPIILLFTPLLRAWL